MDSRRPVPQQRTDRWKSCNRNRVRIFFFIFPNNCCMRLIIIIMMLCFYAVYRCNTGIGKETVLDLAGRGAHIHMACRDYKRCEITRQEIIAKTGNHNVFNRELDLSSMDSIRKFVAK